MTSAAKANRNAEIVDRLEAECRRLRAAYLAHIQMENACKRTGSPCREPEKCGCHIECANLIAQAPAPTGKQTP